MALLGLSSVKLKLPGLEKPGVVGKGSVRALLPMLAWSGGSTDGFLMGKSIPRGITTPFCRPQPREGGSPLLGRLLMPVVTVM